MIKITLLLALIIVAISSHDDKDSKQGCADGSSPLCTDESVPNDDGLCSDGSEPVCAPEIEIYHNHNRSRRELSKMDLLRRNVRRNKCHSWKCCYKNISLVPVMVDVTCPSGTRCVNSREECTSKKRTRKNGRGRKRRGRRNNCMPNGGFCCFRNQRAPTPFAGPCAFGSCVFSQRECKSRRGPKSYNR